MGKSYRKIFFLLTLLSFAVSASAQIVDNVSFSVNSCFIVESDIPNYYQIEK